MTGPRAGASADEAELAAIRTALLGELRRPGPAVHSPPAVALPPPWTGEVRVTTVLPFLLCGPLQRTGALDALTAVLIAQGHPTGLAAFAAALARKVLPSPGHGWHQPPGIEATIAAAAGRGRLPSGSDTERLAATAATWAPVVLRLLHDDLAVASLVSAPTPYGMMFADAEGVFPVAVRLGRPVTDDHGPLGDFVAEMAERPASGRGDLAPELNRPLDLIAGFGLAAVAWRLWQHLEATHPLLALDRFADLDGRAEFTADRVIVRLPLGRRHADLLEHGLLDSVPDVPWFGGRTLELTGG